MPFARIDLRKGKDAAYRREIGRVVYEALVSVGVPQRTAFRSSTSTMPIISCSTPTISASIAATIS